MPEMAVVAVSSLLLYVHRAGDSSSVMVNKNKILNKNDR